MTRFLVILATFLLGWPGELLVLAGLAVGIGLLWRIKILLERNLGIVRLEALLEEIRENSTTGGDRGPHVNQHMKSR